MNTFTWFGHWQTWVRLAGVWILGGLFVAIVFSFIALGSGPRDDD